jgi:uncharacterized DUF497 family protein
MHSNRLFGGGWIWTGDPRQWKLGSLTVQNWLDAVNIYTYTVHMTDIRFEWSARKNRDNKRKHGISFEEAQTVFLDERAIRYFDPDHLEGEERFIMLGMSFRLRLLVVCHCYGAAESVIRIISARKANKKEAVAYWG